MPLKINDNTKLPDLKPFSDNEEVIKNPFTWEGKKYTYVRHGKLFYRIQINFSEKEDWFDDWDVDFIYSSDMVVPRNKLIRLLSYIEKDMPKTWDINVIKNWCKEQTELALSYCTEIK